MTIKVEREALLRLLASKPATSTTLSTTRDCHPEYQYVVSIQKPAFSTVPGRIRDDDDSVYTNSTGSLSLDSDDDKRVSFATPLVTEVWTREYTSKDEICYLYYSAEETQRFRQEYRSERKVFTCTDSSIDINSNSKKAPAAERDAFYGLLDRKWQPQAKHQISRVVIVHNDKLETYEGATSPAQDSSNDFFDSDSFWSGSITWY